MAENRKARLIRYDMLFTAFSQNGYTIPIEAFCNMAATMQASPDGSAFSLADASPSTPSIPRKKRQITGSRSTW